jgi:hypothetical protein
MLSESIMDRVNSSAADKSTEEFMPPDLSAYMNQLEQDICQLNTQISKSS